MTVAKRSGRRYPVWGATLQDVRKAVLIEEQSLEFRARRFRSGGTSFKIFPRMTNRIVVETHVRTGGQFVDFFDYQGRFNTKDSIEGALVLTIDGTPLIDKSMFDYVDDLWSYLSEGLLQVSEGRSFSCFFPDQPIEVKLTPGKHRLQVSVTCHSEVSVAVDKDEFVRVMSEHARRFFTRLQALEPRANGTCTYALGYLNRIRR
ncbi:hypothetical protein [Stenotrophomonas maltophilia]|uniref:hypothetical protein n=1 Tax=Stenotrophomonas maltophilia TaxID=40324 RepID=UPI0015DFB4E6|nr:hypothetical protein [Stenotrophomonas maltophilia]MBA0446691.1 hypothetical protein [Stenotrophomonas maltophilia]